MPLAEDGTFSWVIAGIFALIMLVAAVGLLVYALTTSDEVESDVGDPLRDLTERDLEQARTVDAQRERDAGRA
ncbi:MAG: hypothetical protein Q4G40_06275 [Brachybacterium sp.]|nr:hypothetical protein [Brachybacterium sp.]